MNPYPGLRPFAEPDHDFFFGREEEIDDLLDRLTARRFIAVLGVSGCGKSSLVHAGLVPVLRSGLADPLGGAWRIYTLAPGSGPLESLDLALGVRLDRRSHALQSWAAEQGPEEKILIVIDQFEEVFAYRKATLHQDGGNAAAAFVDSLITAVNDPAVPLYVVLTMRTDYLGECALFRGLSEALNDGSYLVPRLSRLRQQDVIERPAASLGVTPQPGLVQRLLNDSEGDPDKLPVLQHLLKQLWELRNGGPLDPDLYRKVGGWDHALENDAEAVLARFPEEHEGIRRAFQWLADAGSGDKPVRRRRPASEFSAVTGLPSERIRDILQAFAKRDFLRCEPGGDGLVDFMHESVMWQWPQLQKWIQEEAEDASRIRFFQEATRRGQLLTGSTLQDAQAFRNRHAASPKWVTRYIENPAGVQQVLAWIVESERRQKDEVLSLRRSRRWLAIGLAVAVVAMLLTVWLGWLSYQSRQAAENEIARNYWSESRYAQEKGKDLASLHFAAESVRLQPVAERSILLDVRAIWPQFAVVHQFQHQGPVLGARFTRDGAGVFTWSADGTARRWDARTGSSMGPAMQHQDGIRGAQFSRDESRVLTWSDDGTARVWDARTGLPISAPTEPQEYLWGAQFSHDESRILTWGSQDLKDFARLWDARTGKAAGPRLEHSKIIEGALFSRDDSRILTWCQDDTARLWDALTGHETGPSFAPDGAVKGALFSRDDSRILTWSETYLRNAGESTLVQGELQLWDARTGRPVSPALHHAGRVNGAQFNHDESLILASSDDGTAQLWNARTGHPALRPLQHRDAVSGARFSRDENRILTWSADHTARLWDARTGQPAGPPLQHQNGVRGARFSSDESRILTWSFDGSARLWDTGTGSPVGTPLWHQGSVNGAEFSPDENRILTWSIDGTARLWDVRTALPAGPVLRHEKDVNGALFNHDESRILTWSDDHTVRIWDARTGQPLIPPLQHQDGVGGALFSRDENRILTWSHDHTVRLWDARTGRSLCPPLQQQDAIVGAQFNHDETRILAWDWDSTARLWDARTCSQLLSPLQHRGWVVGARFSPDDSRILTWSEDKTAQLWDAHTGQPVLPPLQHQGRVIGALFNRDASRILTWSDDNTARLWDARTGQAVVPPLQHQDWVNGAVFNRDESRILTWSGKSFGPKSGEARLWNARTGQPVGPALRHRNGVDGALFNRDETRILTWSGGDSTAQLWDAGSGLPLGPPLQHQGYVYGAEFSSDERLILTWSRDGTARLWDARTGMAIGSPFEHEDLNGAHFSRDESRVLTSGNDGTARVWLMNIDMDFPSQYVPLSLQSLSASEFDFVTRQVKPLPTAAWREARELYEKIAADHAKSCRYPEFNEYVIRKKQPAEGTPPPAN